MKILSLSVLLLLSSLFLGAQTKGSLSVSTATSSCGGKYNPKNILAIWIEDENGKFIKTLLAYGNKRQKHLNTWESSTTKVSSVYNKIDAITAATQKSHGNRTCTWDGTNFNKNEVNDGTYKVCMELTDKNNSGNYSAFTFSKGTEAVTLSPANKPSFSAISIQWTPTTNTALNATKNNDSFRVFPNRETGIFTIKGENMLSIEVYSINGKMIKRSSEQIIDLSNQPNGLYIFKIKSNTREEIMKVVKQK